MFTLSCHKKVKFSVKSVKIAFSGVRKKIVEQNSCLLVTIQCIIFNTVGIKGLIKLLIKGRLHLVFETVNISRKSRSSH